MEQQILSVGQINRYIQSSMENDPVLAHIAVRGEISNYKIYPSGHHYFTLKDESSALRCVMFRSSASSLKFRPESGMQVVAVGRISVYPRDGAYQLYCNKLIVDGVGDLYAAFEQLKAKLSAQGLFDPSHKKPLPIYPKRIGIVTSSAGAAIHDILKILKKRYPLTKAILLPVRVQGVEAPGEICDAIAYANEYKLADILIVGRGGGSMEDLWAFNDERVAWAIYHSEIPVISAVGHEPDVTISDFVSDVRAATPSNAAELAVPDQNALKQQIDSASNAITSAFLRHLRASRQQLTALASSPALKDPERYIHKGTDALKMLNMRLHTAQGSIVFTNKQRYLSLTAKLDAMSPLKVLTRGYAIVQSENGALVKSVMQTKVNDRIAITLQDGAVHADVIRIEEKIQ